LNIAEGQSTEQTVAMPASDRITVIISPLKVRSYLLSSAHPVGCHKSAFFRSLGYRPEAPQILERDLIALVQDSPLAVGQTIYGQKYAAKGVLVGPNGRKGRVMTIWIILIGELKLRFVTAYPED
jgi:hypothetical protein